MFGSLGAPELIVIGLVLVLLFGVGKISGLGRELGTSIKEFRRAVKDEDSEEKKQGQANQQPPAPSPYQQTTQTPPPPVAAQPPAQGQPGENRGSDQPGIF